MYASKSVGVVIPAYNEAAFIRNVVEGIPAYVDRVYVVDDASTDDTWDEILRGAESEDGCLNWVTHQTDGGTASDSRTVEQQLDMTHQRYFLEAGGDKQAWDIDVMADSDDDVHQDLAKRAGTVVSQGRVVAVGHERNLGAGGAIVTGYLAALADDVDVVVTIDGDGQMSPEIMSSLLEPVVSGESGYAKGNRLLQREYRSEMPTFRLVGNAILTFLTKLASGYWGVMDPQNGYTVISREALRAIGPTNIYEGYGYCNDVLIKLNVTETRIADVPTVAQYSDEESHISYSSYIPKVSMLLLSGFFWRLKYKYLILNFHPLALFYFSGVAMAGVGLLSSLYTVWGAVALEMSVLFEGIVSALLLIIGLLCLLFAMVFDRQVNNELVCPQQFDSIQ